MFYKKRKLIVYWLMVGLTSSGLLAQVDTQRAPIDPVTYTVKAPDTIKPGDRFTIAVVFDIAPDWYVYAPIDMNIALGKIPTKVSFKAPDSFKKIGELKLPDDDRFFDTYSGKSINMSQMFQVEKNSLPGKQTIKVHIVYQTCNDHICYPPVREKIDIVITVHPRKSGDLMKGNPDNYIITEEKGRKSG